MEFMDGTWKKEINTWEELVGNNLLNQEAVIEGAVHSIRNMGDVAFIILRRREGLFQTVYENEMANVSIHELKEAMGIKSMTFAVTTMCSAPQTEDPFAGITWGAGRCGSRKSTVIIVTG